MAGPVRPGPRQCQFLVAGPRPRPRRRVTPPAGSVGPGVTSTVEAMAAAGPGAVTAWPSGAARAQLPRAGPGVRAATDEASYYVTPARRCRSQSLPVSLARSD